MVSTLDFIAYSELVRKTVVAARVKQVATRRQVQSRCAALARHSSMLRLG